MAAQPLKVGMRRQPRQARSQERVNRILDVAEEMFIHEGYEVTTTNAIASRAEVPIGTLYQFFGDKTAILYGLVERYISLLQERFYSMDGDPVTLPLPQYVEQIVDTVDQFFEQYPGYHAIFMQAQGSVAELEQLDEAMDTHFIQNWAVELGQRDPSLTLADREAIAFVLVKTIGTILWLSLGQPPQARQRLVAETKRLTLSYLESYHR